MNVHLKKLTGLLALSLRRRAIALMRVAVLLLVFPLFANADDVVEGKLNRVSLEAFVDGVWHSHKARDSLVGAVVTVVHDGRVVFNKGYGFADIDARRPVDPERTLFRIASISKPFTWLAVMQLVENGQLNLDHDVNEYLGPVQIPATYPEPVTMRHLMSHSAGFEDSVLNIGHRNAEDLLPLASYLANNLPERVRPAGQYSAYSNHSTALAAQAVAQVSGQDWSDYVEQKVLGPLGMQNTVVRHPMPEKFQAELAKGYSLKNGEWQPNEFLHWQIYPAGMISTTGADMAKFMLSQLDGAAPLLDAKTHQQMLSLSFQPFTGANGWRHGFVDRSYRGTLAFGHGGDYNGYHSQLLLLPEQKLGVFASFNSDDGDAVSADLTRGLMGWLLGDKRPERPEPEPEAASNQAQYAGTYAPLRRSFSDFAKLRELLGGARISTNEAGYLVYSSSGRATQFVASGEDRFQARYADSELFFHRDSAGAVSHFTSSGYAASTMDRLAWHAEPKLHQALFTLALLMFLGCVVCWPWASLRRRARRVDGQAIVTKASFGTGIAWLLSFSVIYALIELVRGLQDPLQFTFQIPAEVHQVLIGSAVTTILGVLFGLWWMVDAFRTNSGGASSVSRSLFFVAMALFAFLTWYWNMLGYAFSS